MHQYLKAISLAACISLSAQQIENPSGMASFAQNLKQIIKLLISYFRRFPYSGWMDSGSFERKIYRKNMAMPEEDWYFLMQ